jgi:hypothetical protein
MPLDSNSRLIAGFCGAAVLLLATWLHGNGKGVAHGLARCEATSVAPSALRAACKDCDPDDARQAGASRVAGEAASRSMPLAAH